MLKRVLLSLAIFAGVVFLFSYCKKDRVGNITGSGGGNGSSSGGNPPTPPNPGNRPPVADAGRDTTVVIPIPSVILDGRKSYDPDTNLVSYHWQVLESPVYSAIDQADSAKSFLVLPRTGIYRIELKVTDAGGLWDTDTVVITVNSQPACYNTPNNCAGYWICLPNTGFSNVKFFGTPSFIGAYGASASAGNKMYFAGGHEEGYIGGVLDAVVIYDVVATTWSERRLSVARSHLSGASSGNKVLFAGGNNFYTVWSPPPYGITPEYYNTVDIFDINSSEPSTAHLSESRSNMASASSADKCFFIGGRTATGYSAKMDIYNAATGSWSVVDLPRARGDAGAVVVQNRVFVIGGKGSGEPYTVIDIYDLATQTWSTLEMPHTHPVASVALVNNRIVVAGGNGSTSKYVDIYDLVSTSWSSTELSDSRYGMAVAVANNKAIFLGGNYSCNVDIFDGATGVWSLTHLNEGVTGLTGTSIQNKLGFTGILYSLGNAMVNTAIIIDP